MSLEKMNTTEEMVNKNESITENPEVDENVRKLADEALKNEENLAIEDKINAQKMQEQVLSEIKSETPADLPEKKTPKIENLTPEQKEALDRLYKNAGYTPETLAADQEKFKGLGDKEMYQTASQLLLVKFYNVINNIPVTDKNKKELVFVKNKLSQNLKTVQQFENQAMISFADVVDDANHKPDGYMYHDGLTDDLKKLGYTKSMFASPKARFDKFKDDLLGQVLSSEQKEIFEKISASALKGGLLEKTSAGAAAGMSQKTRKEPIVGADLDKILESLGRPVKKEEMAA